MIKKLILNVLCFSFLSVPLAINAETQYIKDEVFVPVRSGAGNQFRIIHRGIRSGTKLEAIEVSEDGDWTHIKTDGGLDGWVRTQYLSKTPTAKLLLEQAELTAEKKTAQVAYLQAEIQAIQEKLDTLNTACQTLENEKRQCETDLKAIRALSADSINLNDRYQELLAKHDLTQTELDSVRAENDRLRSDSAINQWLVGAGLVFAGVLLAIIAPRLRGKKQYSEWRN